MSRTALLAAVWSVGVVAAGAQGAVNSLLVFGDSLSDTGNVFAGTGGTLPASPPYFQGRFSNGPLWVDRLADGFGLPRPTPAFGPGGGNNFAIGGSRVNAPAVFVAGPVVPFSDIVGGYVAAGPAISPDTLVTIWIGNNDFLNYTPALDVDGLATTVRQAMLGLAGKGARQFLLVNVPPVGNTPAVVGGSFAGGPSPATVNAAVQQYNQRLSLIPGVVEQLVPGSTVYSLDTFTAFQQVLANPGAVGLTNLTLPALNTNTGTVVPNPDQYLWWDAVHPTATGHRFIGAAAVSAVPEPGAVGLLALAGAGLVRRRTARA